MKGIPTSVRIMAERIWLQNSGDIINGMRGEVVVALAILAERQRCADLVHGYMSIDQDKGESLISLIMDGSGSK